MHFILSHIICSLKYMLHITFVYFIFLYILY